MNPSLRLTLGLIEQGWPVSEACELVVAAERDLRPGEWLPQALWRVLEVRAAQHFEAARFYSEPLAAAA